MKKSENALLEKRALGDIPESYDDFVEGEYEKLAIVFILNQDFDKASPILEKLAIICKKNYLTPLLGDDEKTITFDLKAQTGRIQSRKGFFLILAHHKSAQIHQFFEWAVDNCTLPEDYLQASLKNEDYDELSFAHLWHGYALVSLEKFAEALPFLEQVIPFQMKWKKMTGEIYRKIEFALPKALIPLCQFKLNPTRQNLINAQKGIEEYIKSLREPKDKLDGYLYYFHLKDQFADVYSADPKDYPEEAVASIKEPVRKTPASESAEPQTVWIWDVVSITVGEEFGTDDELNEYSQNVTRRGEFPVLSKLYDLYLQWDEFDAAELAEETRRLLAMNDLDPEIRKKTEILKDIAEYSAEKGSGRLVLKPENPE
jgi:tetratricopeptide (TPR) repeat protein